MHRLMLARLFSNSRLSLFPFFETSLELKLIYKRTIGRGVGADRKYRPRE